MNTHMPQDAVNVEVGGRDLRFGSTFGSQISQGTTYLFNNSMNVHRASLNRNTMHHILNETNSSTGAKDSVQPNEKDNHRESSLDH